MCCELGAGPFHSSLVKTLPSEFAECWSRAIILLLQWKWMLEGMEKGCSQGKLKTLF